MRTHSERHGHHSDFGFVILHVQMMVDQSPHWARHRLHVSDSYQPMELATCSDDLEKRRLATCPQIHQHSTIMLRNCLS